MNFMVSMILLEKMNKVIKVLDNTAAIRPQNVKFENRTVF